MAITIQALGQPSPAMRPVEIVERKGLGHPDTLCDAMAERLSAALCRAYLDRCGMILHHNVDKVLLWGGAAEPAFGGGRVTAPLEIYLSGRATVDAGGAPIPIEELAVTASREVLGETFHALDVDKHVKIHCLIRPGSVDLRDLFTRAQAGMAPLANDTSCGAGYAPLSDLERAVLAVEQHLNSPAVKARAPETGEDVKVMGLREGDELSLTIGCAFVDRHVMDLDDYLTKKAQVAVWTRAAATEAAGRKVSVQVNTADDPQRGNVYLTVTGTSAEAGDDGEAGRGNRANGLITPYRPMTMESVAGKNPVTHTGKLYNLAANRIAAALVDEVAEVTGAEVYLLSQIGQPVTEPRAADLRLDTATGKVTAKVTRAARDILDRHLRALPELWRELI